MQRTLSDHITSLEEKIEAIKDELGQQGSSFSRENDLRIDLGIAERALVYFRKAFELERKLFRSR